MGVSEGLALNYGMNISILTKMIEAGGLYALLMKIEGLEKIGELR